MRVRQMPRQQALTWLGQGFQGLTGEHLRLELPMLVILVQVQVWVRQEKDSTTKRAGATKLARLVLLELANLALANLALLLVPWLARQRPLTLLFPACRFLSEPAWLIDFV